MSEKYVKSSWGCLMMIFFDIIVNMKYIKNSLWKTLLAAGAAVAIFAISAPVNAADTIVPDSVKNQANEVFGANVTASELKPVLVLKSDTVTVNNGDVFNPSSFITYINDKSGVLPALTINSNVDMSTDGTYTVTYRAVGLDGQSVEKTLNVVVKTPEEVLAAQAAEAERIAQEQAAAEEAARQQELQAQEEAAAKTAAAVSASLGSGSGSATASSIIATARSLLGSPYVWGGTSPSGFDCSGFTQYVYGLNGIGLSRDAASQAGSGYQISESEAQAGDLVIWSGHVAIYEGNGYVIEASNPSVGVTEHVFDTSWGSGSYYGIYRIYGVNG